VRVTEEVKRRTRARLLEAAERLVRTEGIEAVTTRDVAVAAGVGHGTLFNYFASREAMALALCDVLLARAAADVARSASPPASFEESLFAYVAACLRRLKPLRAGAGVLLASLLVAPDADGGDEAAEAPSRVRRAVVGALEETARRHAPERAMSATSRQLWASLVVGVVCAWARDPSPHQEDTLALLDRATRLFVASLDSDVPPEPGRE
jgi:TetR/AcrR family transcriptional repressor of nem operon